MKITTPQQYQYVYFQHQDFYAKQYGLDKPERILTKSEIVHMVDGVCEEVRQLYKLTESEHLAYREMMRIIFFGKNKGHKGKRR